jgi:type II restriction enzyme
MLLDIILDGRFNPKNIIDKLSYNTKNDKAFSVSGAVTHRYMQCQRLAHPIIQKTEIKNIILGGGEKLLSPERRLDAVLVASPHLFL